MQSEHPQEKLDEIDFVSILDRFIALNQARLERAREGLKEHQHDFLDLLPLIFHLNHPALPGFHSADTPAGIIAYQPESSTLAAARRRDWPVDDRQEADQSVSPPILAIYFMGSFGSVAYSEESDCDIWLCHDPELDPKQRDLLREKANRIEAWAADFDLEVHIFLVSPNQFRAGETIALNSESSGSAQCWLLLEEFYRTGLRLAGLYPIWWLVPPHREAEYDSYINELRVTGFSNGTRFIDFGPVAQIPAEEFLGAAVWQLYKGIDSPYKSFLKLLLIESYAREYPRLDLLSLRFKSRVYGGGTALDHLDPYLMILEKVEAYLEGTGDSGRIALARRCFYLKVNENLSRDDIEIGWRRELLAAHAGEWGWSHKEFLVLDNREHWKVQQVTEERRMLFHAFSQSYRFLSNFARRYADSALISQRDLTILGRKLYAAFERKAGKIELLGHGISADLSEPHLSLFETIDTQGSSWVLYSGMVAPEAVSTETPIKRTRNLTQLVAWCFFNQILRRDSSFSVFPKVGNLSIREIRQIVERLFTLFPQGVGEAETTDDFARPARAVNGVIFVGRDLPDEHSVDLVLLNSWQEVLTFHYVGNEGMLECLCELLKWSPQSAGLIIRQIGVESLGDEGRVIAQRISQLFDDVSVSYYENSTASTRYVVQIEQRYYVLVLKEDCPRFERLSSYQELLQYLSSPRREYSPVGFDRYAASEGLLPLIFAQPNPGMVQFFYQVLGEEVEIHVLDELGSLFHQKLPFHDRNGLLNHYSRFFESALRRVNFLMQEGHSQGGVEGVEFFEIQHAGSEDLLERQAPRFDSYLAPYVSLQVIMDVDQQGKTLFSIYYGELEFSSLELGDSVFDATAQYVLDMRKAGQTYPIYITDLSMSPKVLGPETAGKIQTIHFLTYKHRIEEQLNEAMSRLLAKDV